MPTLMLKLDIAKAFDSLAWPFFFEVLRQRGFGPRWLARTACLLSTASTGVLVNGIPGDQFWHARGLRQEDPSSPIPMWFILAFDVMNAIFKLAEANGVFASLQPSSIRHRLSLFADDAVLLMKPMAFTRPSLRIKLTSRIYPRIQRQNTCGLRERLYYTSCTCGLP
jgi:hypothetical protein